MNARGTLLAALAASSLLAACGKEPDKVPERPSPTATIPGAPQNGDGRTVTDQAGRLVTIPAEVRSVAALSPAAADFAVALGLEVVARTTDTPADAFPGAKPAGSSISPDFNAVAAANPDLVIADAAYQSGRTRDFDRFSKPVFVLKATSHADVLTTLKALGEATGRQSEADAALASLETRASAALAKAKAKGSSPKVLVLTGGGRDVFGGGAATYLGSLLSYLGATNVLGAVADGGPIPGFGVIEVTAAAAMNPDAVLILPSGQGGLAAQIKADSAWANVPAVKQGRVVDLDTTLFLRAPGPRAGEALEKLVALLWP